MFQIAYEYAEPWPLDGPAYIKAQFETEVAVSPEAARRTANGYLTLEVGMALQPGEPTLILGGRPVWRMLINLHLRGLDKVATLGAIDVDALTDEVIPFSEAKINMIQERANDIAARLTLETTPTS